MNRRSFFRVVGLAAATVPVAVPLVAEKLATVRQWWRPIQWWTRGFDCGTTLGVAVAVKSTLTGDIRRHAVRLANRAGAEDRGRAFLQAWARGLPPWLPSRPRRDLYGVPRDEVLEGREPRSS